MLKVGILGIGNTGNQIAALGKEKLHIPVIAINSSEKDLETISSDIPRKLIRDKGGLSKGAGKDRSLAKSYLKDSIMGLMNDEDIVSMVDDLDTLYIVSSTGGGTGSGTSPLMADIMAKRFPDVKIILVGILPVKSETLDAHVNTLEYLNELYNVLHDQTYMLYDNDKYSGMPSYQILQKVNEDVVEDINILRCNYNYTTRFNSIDDQDMKKLIDFSGGIDIAWIEDLKEKDCDTATIEEMLIDRLKRNSHVEVQRDKKIKASGLITNLSKTLSAELDDDIPKVVEFTGDPIRAFKHIYINEDRKQPNNVFLIMTGLSKIDDKINKISDRVEEIEERQKVMEEDDALSSIDLSALSEKISDKKKDNGEDQIDLKDIFSNFGL